MPVKSFALQANQWLIEGKLVQTTKSTCSRSYDQLGLDVNHERYLNGYNLTYSTTGGLYVFTGEFETYNKTFKGTITGYPEEKTIQQPVQRKILLNNTEQTVSYYKTNIRHVFVDKNNTETALPLQGTVVLFENNKQVLTWGDTKIVFLDAVYGAQISAGCGCGS